MAGQRMRWEGLRQRVYPAKTSDAIEMGDILVISSDEARPASALTGSTRLTQQDAVADAFIGIAAQGKPANVAASIRVWVDVVAEMDLVSGLAAAQHIGTAVEPETTNSGGTETPEDQKVFVGSTNPIGWIAKEAAVGDTTVTCQFVGKHVKAAVVAD